MYQSKSVKTTTDKNDEACKQLWAAVFARAVSSWFIRNDSSIGSFEFVCFIFDLDPDSVREALHVQQFECGPRKAATAFL